MANVHLLDSPALSGLNKALGATGGGPQTFIDSEMLQISLNVGHLISRARTSIPDGSMALGVFESAHAAGGSQLSRQIAPYLDDANWDRSGGWPSEVTEGFDVWILGATCETTVILGTDSVLLSVVNPAVHTGLNAPAGLAPAARTMPLCFWDTFVTQAGIGSWGLNENGKVYTPINKRLRRGTSLQVNSDSSAVGAITTTVCVHLLITSSGMGQDAVA